MIIDDEKAGIVTISIVKGGERKTCAAADRT